MIEKIIIDYLTEKLYEDQKNELVKIPVYLELPPKLPDRFVVIEKTGSKQKNHITTSTVAIQSYDTTKYATSCLNEKVKEKMLDIVNLEKISKAKLSNDYPFNDISRKRYRYQAVFEIVHY